MFVDYSGLYRYSDINLCFAEKYLHLLEFATLPDDSSKLEYIKQISTKFAVHPSICDLEVEDFNDNMESFLFLIVSSQQIRKCYYLIERCPTLFCLSMQTSLDDQFADDGRVTNIVRDMFYELYKFKEDLLHKAKCNIVREQPNFETTTFEDWNHLQKFLFYDFCINLTDFVKPKTNFIVIPMAFPKLYSYLTDGYGFNKINSKIKFEKLKIRNINTSSFNSTKLNVSDVQLETYSTKVSTIWREPEDKLYIGTASRTLSLSPQKLIQPLPPKNPKFLDIFKERHVNILNADPIIGSNKPASVISWQKHFTDVKQLKHNYNNDKIYGSDSSFSKLGISTSRSSLKSHNNLFSGCHLEENVQSLLTQPTSPLNVEEIAGKLLYPLEEKDSGLDVTEIVQPPLAQNIGEPPTMLFTKKCSEKQARKSERLCQTVKYMISAKCSKEVKTSSSRSLELNTIRSIDDIEPSPDLDISFKTYVKFKMLQMKKDYRYYKNGLKQCIEEIFEEESRV